MMIERLLPNSEKCSNTDQMSNIKSKMNQCF